MVGATPFLEFLRFNFANGLVVIGLVVLMYLAIFRTVPGLTSRPLQFFGRHQLLAVPGPLLPGLLTIKLLLDAGWNRNLVVLDRDRPVASSWPCCSTGWWRSP